MINKFQILFHRVAVIVVLMLFQIAVLYSILRYFNEYYVFFNIANVLLAAVIVFRIIIGDNNPAYKIAWIIPILIFPLFGVLLYLIFGRNRLTIREKASMEDIHSLMLKHKDTQDLLPLEEIKQLDSLAAAQSEYIRNYAYFAPHHDIYSQYLPQGEIFFERLKEELLKARKFIFMEYFIIEEGLMWDSILKILVDKAQNGVTVRLIYDDMGCLFTLPHKYNQYLESLGIECCIFNQFTPVLSSRFNNRNHRKITVIDGETAFTGGLNLADEYINVKPRLGHWKDTGVMLKGPAVNSFTAMFLSLWYSVSGDMENYGSYFTLNTQTGGNGYIQPYSDTPFDSEAVGENIYLNLINKAQRYVYITTPYLVLDNEMVTALCLAAKSGVDIRIVTPHIPDKWYVHMVTRYYYKTLLACGVKIYEYTPGFIHAKTFVCDDKLAVVGTVNLDYRSLYLHMECGVWLYNSAAINEIYKDFGAIISKSQIITKEYINSFPFYYKLMQKFLMIFAPLM